MAKLKKKKIEAVAMLYPNYESEKAINRYSETLAINIKPVIPITYTAGKPLTLLTKFFDIKKYKIVHIQHEYNLLGKFGVPFFILYSLLFMTNVKVVTTMHTVLSCNEKFRSGKIKTFLRKILYKVQNRFIRNTSDIVVVHSDFFKDILVNEYGFDSDKVKVVPQAIIEDVPLMDKDKAKEKFNLKGPVYLIIGSFVPDHGGDIIIKQAKNIDGTILIVSNPTAVNDRNNERIDSFLQENIQYVEDNKIKNVRFDIDPITDKKDEWWQYFSAADLVLLPYRGGIGSGIFSHSMAARTPVVGSDIKFFRDIEKKFNCINISLNNDYSKTIKDSIENLKSMELDCERYRQKFGITNISKLYSDMYFSL